MKPISESTIIICGIVRDAEKGLHRNIPVIDELSRSFKGCHIFIYENDSKDNTKNVLKAWSDCNPNVFVSLNTTDDSKTIPSQKSVPGVNPFFCYKRIEKMVRFRNKYMEFIEFKNWNADYLMVVDMDVSQLCLDGILTSFCTDVKWDAVCAFGYSTSPKLKRRYHDTYALTEWEDRETPQTEDKISKLADKYGNLKPADDWIRVFSGFGGLSIYRFEAVNRLRYKTIFNNDKRVEVKCEHYSLYKQMAERGYDKFYINPSMALKYQDLTFAIILRSLYRKINYIKGKFLKA